MSLPFHCSISSFIISLFIMSKRPCDSSDSSASKRTKVVQSSDLSTLIVSKGTRLFPPCDFCTRSSSPCFHSSDSVRCSTCVHLQRSCCLFHSFAPFIELRYLGNLLTCDRSLGNLARSISPIWRFFRASLKLTNRVTFFGFQSFSAGSSIR